MRQERFKSIDGSPIALDAKKVALVRSTGSTTSIVMFADGASIAIEGDFDTVATRIWPPEPFPI